MVSESRGSGAGVFVIVIGTEAYTVFAGLEAVAGFVYSAVMVVLPGLTPPATPAGEAG
jgi:hypothetical protein